MADLCIIDLPIEVLRHIMSFFSQTELCLTIAPVCKQWRYLAYDPIRWRCVTVILRQSRQCNTSNSDSATYFSNRTLLHLFERVPLLNSLTLQRSYVEHEAPAMGVSLKELIDECAQHCSCLVSLRFMFIPNVDLLLIDRIVSQFQQLQAIAVQGCEQVNSRCIGRIGDLVWLTEVDIAHCINMTDDELDVLTSKLERLTSLNVDGLNHLTDMSVKNLLLTRGRQLRCLKLDGENLTDASFDNLASCHCLEIFEISFAVQLTDITLNGIKKLCLKVLTLRKGSLFTSQGLESLFCNSALCRLEKIDLSECSELNDSCMLAMCQCCGPSLQYIKLQWCWIVSEAGLTYIVETCSKVRELDLCGVHNITCQCFEQVPPALPYLKYLNLQQCSKVNDNIIRKMIDIKPNCVAIDYYGYSFSEDSSILLPEEVPPSLAEQE